MADRVSKEDRSRMMARVKGKNTTPEIFVRSMLHASGYRFRLHKRDLPGSPDIVIPRYRTAVFVHGCFWHGHDCPRGRAPTTNVEFWRKKIISNTMRDAVNTVHLEEKGWSVVVIWTCRLTIDTEALIKALKRSGVAGEPA